MAGSGWPHVATLDVRVMSVELIPARLGHLLALARQVDPGRLALMRKIHADPRRAIASMFDQSRSVLALRVDGHVIAAYGLVGTLLGDVVMIWVLASPAVARHAMAFMRACRDEYRRLAEAEERVTALIIAGDDVAIRFARHWGFQVAEEMTNGAHLGVLKFQRAA